MQRLELRLRAELCLHCYLAEDFMTTQRHIDALRTVLRQIRARLTMLESVAPPEHRDSELRRRIAEVKVEELVALAKLTDLGVEL